MTAVVNQVSNFIIQEQGGLGRTVVLRDRALPYQSFKLSQSQRIDVTWYPGSPVGTAQMLGPELKPSTITGMWKDRFIKSPLLAPESPDFRALANSFQPPATVDGVAVADAVALHNLFESICDQGQLLRVSWDTFIRDGFLTEYEGEFLRVQDVKWEATFTWIGKGQAQGPAAFTQEFDHTDLVANASKNLQDTADATDTQGYFTTAADFISAINANIITANTAVSDLADNLSGVVDAVVSPFDAAQRAAGILTNTAATAQQLMENTQTTVDVEIQRAIPPADVNLGLKMRLANYKRSIAVNARALLSTAVNAKAAMQARTVSPQLLASFVLREATDMRTISTTYYGTPNQWLRLAQYNMLTSSTADAGTVIYVPVLSLGDNVPGAATTGGG